VGKSDKKKRATVNDGDDERNEERCYGVCVCVCARARAREGEGKE
jgi:hypothetical protein